MNDAIPRAAFLVNGTELYGIGQVALTLATELRRRGGTAEMIALGEGALTEQCRADKIPYRLVNLPPWPRFVRSKWKSVVALVRQRQWMGGAARVLAAQLRDMKVERLIVQWPAQVELAGQACRETGIECYWIIPNVISNRWPLGLNKRYYRYLCRRLPITPFANSRYTAATLGGTDVKVLYLGADETRFAPNRVDAVTRAELGLGADECVAGMFARFDGDKGLEPVWRAIVELIREGHNLHLLVVGGPTDGPEANEMRRIADTANAAARLHFVGWTKEPERYYDAVNFAINATIIPESFGLSVVEAMMMGKPVLVHALGGPAETVVDGVTGWHVSAATAEAMTDGLRRVMRDRPRWSEMGEAAQQRAMEHFSATAFVSNFLRMIGRSATD